METKSRRKRSLALSNIDTNKLPVHRRTRKSVYEAVPTGNALLKDSKNVRDREPEDEQELTQFLEDNLGTKQTVEHPGDDMLSKDNLKQLQLHLIEREARAAPHCGHHLCSVENRSALANFRLWFLFELEVSYSGSENIRRSCYFNNVYKMAVESWKMENLFEKTYEPDSCEFFALEQLIIPEISFHEKGNCSDINEVSVVIGDVHDHLKIPHSILAMRNRKEVFRQLSVSAQDILKLDASTRSSTGGSLELATTPSNLLGEKERKSIPCILEKKLCLMHGLKIPKLDDA